MLDNLVPMWRFHGLAITLQGLDSFVEATLKEAMTNCEIHTYVLHGFKIVVQLVAHLTRDFRLESFYTYGVRSRYVLASLQTVTSVTARASVMSTPIPMFHMPFAFQRGGSHVVVSHASTRESRKSVGDASPRAATRPVNGDANLDRLTVHESTNGRTLTSDTNSIT